MVWPLTTHQMLYFRMLDADPGNDEVLGACEIPVLPFVLSRGHLIEDWFPLVSTRGKYKGKLQLAVMVRVCMCRQSNSLLPVCDRGSCARSSLRMVLGQRKWTWRTRSSPSR